MGANSGDAVLRAQVHSEGSFAESENAASQDLRRGTEAVLATVDQVGTVRTPNKNKSEMSRVNASFVASLEARAIKAIVPVIPASVSPNSLTVLGLIGAAITSIGLIACTWSTHAVILVPIGLFLHWFGDSFDGSLARHRRIERPSSGFFIDHSSDLFAMTIIIVGFGFSPFLTITSALLVLATYMLFVAYTYVKVAVEGVHQLAYGGLGATEFRLLMAGWAIAGSTAGPALLGPRVQGVFLIDIVIGVLSGCAFCALAWMAWRNALRIAAMDRKST